MWIVDVNLLKVVGKSNKDAVVVLKGVFTKHTLILHV